MNGLRIIPRLFHSSEIQLFQTICFKITWQQTKKDYKEELVDVHCFPNMTSAVGHKVVLIPDYLHSTFHVFVFSHDLLRMCYLYMIRCAIWHHLHNFKNVKFIRFARPKRDYVISTKKCLQGPRRIFFAFNTTSRTSRRLHINQITNYYVSL